MPKAFLLKRNFVGSDALECHSSAHRVKLGKDVGQGFRSKIYRHKKEKIQDVSQQKGRKYAYPADVLFAVSLENTAINVSLETDCINNKRKSSGAVDPARTHSRDVRLKSFENSKRPSTYNDSDTSTLFSSSGEEDEPQTNCIGINKASKQKINQIKKERTNKAIHRCDQCGKVFKTKYTLSIHLKMPDHTESRPFVCNICGKGFRLSSTLCRHKIIHTQKKPHKCDTCSKCFNRSSTLKTHIRTHSDNKAFTCEVCGKGFHQKGNLRNHIMIHTGEKPFKCPKCQRAFNKMSNLKFHMHIHTDNLPYQCKVCRERFTKKYELKQHNDETHE